MHDETVDKPGERTALGVVPIESARSPLRWQASGAGVQAGPKGTTIRSWIRSRTEPPKARASCNQRQL